MADATRRPLARAADPQGSLRALIPANNVTKAAPKAMVRGVVGWAGGSAGPVRALPSPLPHACA